jgi:membrane protein implicated in regulation of membrane protease activity
MFTIAAGIVLAVLALCFLDVLLVFAGLALVAALAIGVLFAGYTWLGGWWFIVAVVGVVIVANYQPKKKA